MQVELIVAIITAIVAIFTSLLVAGLNLIFKTKAFEDEYTEKVEKIQITLKTKMDRYVIDMIKNKIKNLQEAGFKRWKEIDTPVFSDFLNEMKYQLVSPRELDELFAATSDYDMWSQFIIDGKKVIRIIGGLMVFIGAYVAGVLGLFIYLERSDILVIGSFFGIFIGMYTIQQVNIYRNYLKRVDETYRKVQLGIEI